MKEEDEGRKEEDESRNYSSAGEESREGNNKHGKHGKRNSAPKDGDTNTYANWAVQKLRNHKPSLQVGGELVTFEPSALQVDPSSSCLDAAQLHVSYDFRDSVFLCNCCL